MQKDTFLNKWIGQTVCRNYKIQEKLDQGSFGFIFKAQRKKELHDKHLNTQGDDLYAIKIEENNKNKLETLTQEAKILYELQAEKGFTRMYYFIKTDKMSTMVISLLDKSIDKLFNICSKQFKLKTILMIAD